MRAGANVAECGAASSCRGVPPSRMFFVSLRRSVIELGVDPAGSVSIIPGASQCDSAHNGGL